ncbi:MAG: hypothetical protein M1833_005624 [Piccolia ochrophora]|nr:MAG: hypothetical protein M1833_005624 [Piccolia ochrophora]
MTGFTVPDSSPPSTPDGRGTRKSTMFGGLGSNPSTTPAGPPPSFTPMGPPPSSVFGSSELRSGKLFVPSKPTFASSTANGDRPRTEGLFGQGLPKSAPSFFDGRTKNGTPARPNPLSNGPVRAPQASPPDEESISDHEDIDDSMVDMDGVEEDEQDYSSGNLSDQSALSDSEDQSRHSSVQSQQSTPRGMKRSHGGEEISYSISVPQPPVGKPSNSSAIPTVAKGIAQRAGAASVDEPDGLILATESLLFQLHRRCTSFLSETALKEAALAALPDDLEKLWRIYSRSPEIEPDNDERQPYVIGPTANASPVAKAAYLSNLLLKLHHPPLAKASNSFYPSRASRSVGFSQTFDTHMAGRPLPLPKVLLDWLNTHHNSYPSALLDLRNHQPNAAAHENFWDIIMMSILRGKYEEVIAVLKEADFQFASRATDDDWISSGSKAKARSKTRYSDIEIGNTRRVINRLIQVLEQCPVVQNGDWDVRGNGWVLFRLRADQASIDLSVFAEGGDRDSGTQTPSFSAENFGLRRKPNTTSSLSQASRRAESKVPWSIYQNLKTLYGLLMGNNTELVAFSQDWLEATIALTAWWDGKDDTPRDSRYSMDPRDLNDEQAYAQQLAQAFSRVTSDESDESDTAFSIDSLKPIEVGLASIFEGNIEGVVGILRGWSLTVTSTVIEIATAGGWLPTTDNNSLMGGFNKSDLMVLSYGQPKSEVGRDNVLIEYAEGLFERELLDPEKAGAGGFVANLQTPKAPREGWEIGVQVLGRLTNVELANKKVSELLDWLPLESSLRVDKVLDTCRGIGLGDQARKIAEKYADQLIDESQKYGEALIYYSRAHVIKKLKAVLDLLISFCLVHSAAFPAEPELDDHLRQLLIDPKKTLTELAQGDLEAARLLHESLSGYATLRRFYDLRDEEVNLKPGEKLTHRPLTRQRKAAAALIAVITSAADSIHGGLYDENSGAIVSVDGLLALLGEAVVLVDQPIRILTLPQTFALLQAIEDLQTVHTRVYAQCDEFYRSAVAASQGSQAPSPRATLKKSISSMTSSSGFSLIGSSMLGDGPKDGRGETSSLGSSGVLVKGHIKRGWDWRKILGVHANGSDVCRVLRLGIAREVARAWLEGEEGTR